jgi:cysteine desulfurase/selenocysteine lyase
MSTLTDPLVAGVGKPQPRLDLEVIREEFPILRRMIRNRPLVYLDNAATTQKPLAVLDAIRRYYLEDNSNVHRGVHLLSQRATEAFEGARSKVQRFIQAREEREIIFTRGATEAINLVAAAYGRTHVQAGDEVIVSVMEHHSNIVPWQMLCQEKGAHLRVIPMNDAGELLLDEYEKLLNPRTRLVSVVHVSNALGTVNPVKALIQLAHRRGVPVLIDGAQAVAHLPVNVQNLDCDFYVFSSHKIYGPTGTGVLYGKANLLEAMPPFQGGGDMISSVSFEETVYNAIPHKFEAGTPDVSGVIGLGAALDYLSRIGLETAGQHERDLLAYATASVGQIEGVRIIGTAQHKAGVLSFILEGVHPHDIGTILDQEGIAIRTGHHCAQPVMDRLGLPATARASFAFYNTFEEVDRLTIGLKKVKEIFS